MTEIPTSHLDLLERPVYGVLGCRRPDGQLQANPMWFEWDGDAIRMTHTRTRQKYANLRYDSHAVVLIVDPENAFRYLEVRSVLKAVEPDPTAAFFDRLAARYGTNITVDDGPDRVILVFEPRQVSVQ